MTSSIMAACRAVRTTSGLQVEMVVSSQFRSLEEVSLCELRMRILSATPLHELHGAEERDTKLGGFRSVQVRLDFRECILYLHCTDSGNRYFVFESENRYSWTLVETEPRAQP